jgi:hypothetical protein
MTSKFITLDVSGRKFRTSKAVLSVSPYFEGLLSRWEDCADLQPDGSYYIDADPDTFEHLLNFIRRPAKFPLYWTKKDGFDYALYSRLEMEADYFMLEGLRDWIKEKKYLEAIRTTTTTFLTQVDSMIGNPTSDIGSGETAVTSLVVDVGGDHYACPTGVHPREGPACYAYNSCRNTLARRGGSQWVKPRLCW